MAEMSMSWINEWPPKFDSPIFCEAFAKIRMEKFEKLKKKKTCFAGGLSCCKIHGLLGI